LTTEFRRITLLNVSEKRQRYNLQITVLQCFVIIIQDHNSISKITLAIDKYNPEISHFFSFKCMFCKSLFVLLYFFFWQLCCLFFFGLRILITSLWYRQTRLPENVWALSHQTRSQTMWQHIATWHF